MKQIENVLSGFTDENSASVIASKLSKPAIGVHAEAFQDSRGWHVRKVINIKELLAVSRFTS